MNIDKHMKDQYGAVGARMYPEDDDDTGEWVEVFVNMQTQQRFLVEVIDGNATVYSFAENVKEGKK